MSGADVADRSNGNDRHMNVGTLLKPLRSGDRLLASNDPRLAAPATVVVSSPAFDYGTEMPAAYRGVSSVSPPLRWAEVPPETREFALVVEDVDVPFPAPLVHAIAYGIAPDRRAFDAGAIPGLRLPTHASANGFRLGRAAGVAPGYLPVTPIPGHGDHRYVYQIFALDTRLAFDVPPSKRRIVDAMAGHVLAWGKLVGTARA